jgi:hypothetical protein
MFVVFSVYPFLPTVTSLQFADVNAFLTLAATQHTLSQEELAENPRMKAVVDAAKAGKVSVKLVSSKSPLEP